MTVVAGVRRNCGAGLWSSSGNRLAFNEEETLTEGQAVTVKLGTPVLEAGFFARKRAPLPPTHADFAPFAGGGRRLRTGIPSERQIMAKSKNPTRYSLKMIGGKAPHFPPPGDRERNLDGDELFEFHVHRQAQRKKRVGPPSGMGIESS
ncbi:hypothetical protein FQR65_LT18799 [Abscondita terminalis]|nr:hypothetical protein FQR65_LT18799 [Abscondita terminalis]